MRKLKLQMQVSIDGFVSADRRGVQWQVWDFGPEWTWGPELAKGELVEEVGALKAKEGKDMIVYEKRGPLINN